MKKIICIILTLGMVLSMFVSCDKAKTDGDSSNNKEKVTIKVFGPSNVEEFLDGEDENNNAIINYMKDFTGYDIEWTISPAEGGREKLNAMMAAGVDTPDIIVSTDRTLGLDYTNEGLLQPVDDYLEKATNLAKVLDPDSQEMMIHDGKQYAIVVPQNQSSTAGMMSRKDKLAEVGYETVPETIDEYYDALVKLKEKFNVAPLTGSYSNNVFDGLEVFKGAFGVATNYRESSDGKLEATATTSDMKDLLTYTAKLYEEGLLDPEYPVNTSDKVTEKLVNGQAIMYSTWWTSGLNLNSALDEIEPGASYEVIGVPVGANGQSGAVKNPPARIYFYFPIFSEVIQDSVMLIDAYTIKEFEMVVSYGWEGEHYNIEEDGTIVQTEKAEDIRFRIYYQLWDTVDNFLNRVTLKGFDKEYYAMEPYAVIEDPMWYAPVIEEYQDKNQSLLDIQNQYFIKFITGALPLDDFDKFVDEYNTSGGQEVLDAINEWYTNK